MALSVWLRPFLYADVKQASNIDGTIDVYASNATDCIPLWQGIKDASVKIDVKCHSLAT